ncbi:MAG TPA: NAAT family transporter [Nitratifractor sp.]|jgi:multiple antibiotic resistance protein|nr:NAAT family transporter [Nitratifractor sp.]
MTEYLSLILHDTIALITILNPIAAASIMVSMLDGDTDSVKSTAFKATVTVFFASLVTLFGGEFIFKLFGINVHSLKVIGGVILMLIAVNMAYGQASKARHTPSEAKEAEEKDDISIVPIGIPILFGPGAIATIIVLNSNLTVSYKLPVSYAVVTVSIALSSIVVFFTLRYSGAIHKALGVTGMKILTRIMGLIVGAIAAQFLVSGIKALWL